MGHQTDILVLEHSRSRSQRKSTGTRAAGGAAPATTATFQLRSQVMTLSDLLDHFGLFAAGLCTAHLVAVPWVL